MTEDLPLDTYCPLLNYGGEGSYSLWLQKLKCGYHPTVLAALAAFASFSSSHPCIVGAGEMLPNTTSLAIDYQANRKLTCISSASLVSASKRRANTCRDLYESARKMAWETGAMAEVSHENAIACYLLDAIETSEFYKVRQLYLSDRATSIFQANQITQDQALSQRLSRATTRHSRNRWQLPFRKLDRLFYARSYHGLL